MSPTLRSGVIVPNVLSYFFGGGLRGLEKIPMRVGHLIGIGGVKIEHRKKLSSGEPFEIGGLENSDVWTPMFCDGDWFSLADLRRLIGMIGDGRPRNFLLDRKRVVWGWGVAVVVALGG